MGKQKINIPMCAALILLLLTMISVHITSGLYARYTSTATAQDSARVAKFDVQTTLTADKSQDGVFTLTVINNSDVTVRYKVEVMHTAPMNVSLGGETKHLQAGETSVVFENPAWILAYGGGKEEHSLRFTLADISYVTEDATGMTASKDATFSVNVTAEQVD